MAAYFVDCCLYIRIQGTSHVSDLTGLSCCLISVFISFEPHDYYRDASIPKCFRICKVGHHVLAILPRLQHVIACVVSLVFFANDTVLRAFYLFLYISFD